MMGKRTFGQKLGAGFAVTILITLLMGALAITALSVIVSGKDAVISTGLHSLVESQRLHSVAEEKVSASRGYLLTGEQRYLADVDAARAEFSSIVEKLRLVVERDALRQVLETVARAESDHEEALTGVVSLRRNGAALEVVGAAFEERVAPRRVTLERQIDGLRGQLELDLEAARDKSSAQASRGMILVAVIGALAITSAIVIAVRLSSGLRREVGSTVGQIQRSSAELESAAAQQASGGREQATAMSEITTTISELLITSRQIAGSTQRVSKIAEDTADAARSGDATIEQTRTSIAAIGRQVDLIVAHMLELGENSQQIGGVVDLVSELAEQTNILAINATIEASGAGEWGRRFAVVAEEIRKLADRTARSAKEIRALIDDVRSAVNTTVMATETGAKAVDTGTRQFDEATDAFRRIVHLVSTTNEASREIELSTKQQATAVEQVSAAVADTARVTRETEASATQTRQTASHLAGLSTGLLQLVGTRSGGPT